MNSTQQSRAVSPISTRPPLSSLSPPSNTPLSPLASPRASSPLSGTPRASSPALSHSGLSGRSLSPPMSPSSSGSNVFSRLTNTRGYTGSHKMRFDEEGRGLGKAGREDLVEFDGLTPSPSRSKAPRHTAALNPSVSKTPVVKGPLGTQKFGTQARVVYLYRNGDKLHDGEKVVVKATYRNMQQFYDDASARVKLVTGPVRRIYKADLKTLVRGLDQFEDGGRYLCCAGEGPIVDRIPPSLLG
ncbi:hypothetical protein BC938DRAFT_479914 [Jimgerdemannia flammicorona]|uniref:Doublecortin domain-containing protein n=1 Tax=Jimgerdemannia flammicorona TaxID=994334 RepID=A0A433QJW3_9FUNG|nr:hypothetical protein BC938DRAFT_479914 [Jimgerdemannia flammicorona]